MKLMGCDYSTIILASGLSVRMHKPKAMLQWDKSTTFLEKIISEYSKSSCSHIICVINNKVETFLQKLEIPQNVKFVLNTHPEWERIYAIKTGLQEVHDCKHCFIQNVDNPFVNVEIIEKLYAARSSEAWSSPVYKEKGGHPVLIPQLIIQKIIRTTNNNTTLLDILKPFPRIKVETENDLILRNINTPEDYKRYFNCKSK